MRLALPLSLLLVLAACAGDHGTGPTDNAYGITATGPGVLSVSPLDTSTVVWTTPLGSLNPPGHVLPTDHVYVSFVDPYSGQQQNNDCRARPVYAAGSGVVIFTIVTEAAGDTKVEIQMTKTFHYYYDHVLLLPGIKVGTHVNAGEQIATTTGRCPSIDLGVYDEDVTLSRIVNAARYGPSTLHAVSPYKYFTPALRAFYYARVRVLDGVPVDKDGRLDYGVSGRLAGDWFHSSLAGASYAASTGSPDGWSKTLAFVNDWYDGSPRISIGGIIATPGVLKPASGDPDPADVSTTSGIVAYQGTPKGGLIRAGWLLVQMTAADRIKVEYFTGATARPAAFTAAAQEYRR
jgi:hypothetical protein